MLISIIVPHKNSPKKLKRLLDSVDENENIEVIVVDDNSHQDLKPNKISDFKSNVMFFNNIHNNNAGSARNLGLQHATGKWVIFADSDDEFVNNAFNVLLESLQKEKHSDIIFYDCIALKEDTGEPSERANAYSRLLKKCSNERKNIAYNWIVPWGKAIRRDLIVNNNIKFDSRMASNDVMFSTHLAYHIKNFSIINSPLYICYESNTSLTANLDSAKAFDRLGALVDRNIFLIKHRVDVKKDYGFAYFIKTQPLIFNTTKYTVYCRWVIVSFKILSEIWFKNFRKSNNDKL